MKVRLALLVATVALLALPSSAGADPLWDCTDVPFRVTPFSCAAYGAVEDVLNRIPPP